MVNAIETVYDGHRFRSRLEARWAVFFRAVETRYEYESEGFDLGDVKYLPDFYLPTIHVWAEIKPMYERDDEKGGAEIEEAAKSLRLLREQRDAALLICGTPGRQGMVLFAHDISDSSGGTWEKGVKWAICARCHKLTLDFTGIGPKEITDYNFQTKIGCGCADFEVCRGSSLILREAYALASQARFEHGEAPWV